MSERILAGDRVYSESRGGLVGTVIRWDHLDRAIVRFDGIPGQSKKHDGVPVERSDLGLLPYKDEPSDVDVTERERYEWLPEDLEAKR